ncbi:hypothetical protein CORC01_00556 [Colletotrichum orchidophilum]|uniref:Uncharacterized protein n=1 Tax=Colletotrichum orchidophilum TaxID=1209926 RepID=A0A1G4BSH7_9PEZI|nr:uncharacterized protein CORC01_00556 [Colletotrichum orchidophilum]OHF04217.1 hypothetical protein CORC01_00556 [Colletotrichum orchidophilum]
MFGQYNHYVLRETAQMPLMRFTMPRVPKMIEAICPGCFKGFTKIGSMHRHAYEDRCPNPVPHFVAKVKAEHRARVTAAAARSKARKAARASRADPRPVAPTPAGGDRPGRAREASKGRGPALMKNEHGSHFVQQKKLVEMHQQHDTCTVVKTEPDLLNFDFNCLTTTWEGVCKSEPQWP